MSNVRRLKLSDRIFFVTANLNRGIPPLVEAEFPVVLKALDESRRRMGFGLCGYALMPDHWHALIWTHYPLTISRVVQEVKYVSARRLNRRRKSKGPLWQHRFWDRFVRHAKEFRDRMNYMHLNPVRKGLVAHPGEWPWSSYRNFSLEKAESDACPVRIDLVLLPEDYRA